MKLTYSLSIDDWVALSLHYLETSAEGRRIRSNGLLIGSIFIFLVSGFAAAITQSITPLLLDLFALAGWYFVVGSDYEVWWGVCGKDGQGVPVTCGMPTLRIARITVGGTG